MRAAALALLLAVGGCATVDIYQYQPKPLPVGSQPLAVVAWTLQDLRNVSWSYGEPDPDPSRRAELAASPSGISAGAREASVAGSPLDLSYAEIAEGVRMVTQMHGSWTIYIYDHQNRLVQIEFSSYAAARLFLDASYALARHG
ncbi:MAG: hypothetical protein JWN44_2417 [Myxococcales bacterium]|nr:hypothetical protein [Myxococcales bacterium]